MATLEIPPLVRQFGKISPAWTLTDLEALHRMSRCGSSLQAIANSLPCLWYYQPKIRASILERCIEGESRISQCVHQNLGSGDHSPLEDGETDIVLSEAELRNLSDKFADLRNQMLELPSVDYEICMSRLDQLMKGLREWNSKQHLKASKRLEFQKRRIATGSDRTSQKGIKGHINGNSHY